MNVIGVIMTILFVLGSILLIIVVLLQDEQGDGIGGLFGGGSNSAFGSRSGNVLTRFTSILGAFFLICSFGLAWINKTSEKGDILGAARREMAQETTEWWTVPENTAAPEAQEAPDAQE